MIRRVKRVFSPAVWLDGMDLGRWVSAVVVGCVAVAVWALPPQRYEFRFAFEAEPPTPTEAQLRAVRRAAALGNADRVRAQWLDELFSRFDATGATVVTWMPDDVPEELEQAMSAQLIEAVATRPSNAPPIRLGLMLLDHNQGGHPDLDEVDPFRSDEVYVGTHDGTPYCALANIRNDVDSSHDWLERTSQDANRALRVLGVCGFYATYGVPGAHVAEWLARGGYHYADFVFVDRFPRMGFTGIRGAFGRNDRGVSLRLQSCAAGVDEACERLFLDPEERFNRAWASPVTTPQPPRAAFAERGSAWLDIALLGWLEKEFGAEAVGRFWRSEEPVKEAFEGAFPVSLAEWMRDMTVRTTGTVSRPTPKAANAFGALLFVVLGVGASVFFARRSQHRRA